MGSKSKRRKLARRKTKLGLPDLDHAKAAVLARRLSENSSQVMLNSLETKRSVCKFVSHDQDLQNLPS